MPRDLPILFSGPMVRAILAGAKCQTRRLVKPDPRDGAFYLLDGWPHRSLDGETNRRMGEEEPLPSPFGGPGDSVRVERLGEISEADALAEGVAHVLPERPDSVAPLSAVARFRALWSGVHGDGAWERDCERWVWVVGFERVEVADG